MPVSSLLDRLDIPTIRRWLDDADAAQEFLRSLGVADLRHAHAALVNIAAAGVTLDLVALICEQLAQALPRCADPDMALNNLDRFVAQARSPLGTGTLFERDPTALPSLVQIFSTSQHLSDLLIADPEGFDLLRLTEGAGGATDARRRPRGGNLGPGTRADRAPLATAVQAPRDAADRLRRHHSRAKPANHHGANLLPGRRHSRRRPPLRRAEARCERRRTPSVPMAALPAS